MDVSMSDWVSSSDKSLQPPSWNKGFFLLLQVEVIVGVMAMILVKNNSTYQDFSSLAGLGSSQVT